MNTSYKPNNKILGKCIDEHKTSKFYLNGAYVSDNCIRQIKRFVTTLPFEEVIKIATMSTGINSDGTLSKRCSHQRQNKSTLKLLRKRLLSIKADLFKILLQKKFDPLLKKVESVGEKTRNIGPVAVYDVTLRIASYNDTKPEWIYLHAGTKKGAQLLLTPKLIKEKRKNGETISVQDFVNKFTNDFTGITSEMMEDILCCYYNRYNRRKKY